MFDSQNLIPCYCSLQAAAVEARSAMEKQKDESEARNELQMTALNENLTTIRADMNTHQTRLLEVEKSNDELRGEKLGQ